MTTEGVKIGGFHCINDLRMYLTEAQIEAPEAQTTYIEIPGRNGLLDLSTALTGEVIYNDRTITMNFETTVEFNGKTWSAFLSDLNTLFHGKETQIIFDDDPEYYYWGRCTVSNFALEGSKYSVTITAICEPYKYSISDPNIKSL